MSAGIRELLGLPELNPVAVTGQAEEFAQAFRRGIEGLNRHLQAVAAHANSDVAQPLDSQRQQLYDAFHKATGQIDPVDAAKASGNIERVLTAVSGLTTRATDLASKLAADREAWLRRQNDFDNALLKINELEEAGNPKAATLRKVSDTIQCRANEGRYADSAAAFDQLRPKLDQISAEPPPQAGGVDREKFVAELAALEQALQRLIAEYQLEV